MLHFVVAMGRPGSCFDIREQLATAVRETALLGGELVEHVSPTGTWRIAGIEAPDAFFATRWHVDGESAVLSNGCAVQHDGRVSLEATLARFRSGGAEAARGPLLGTYNLVCLSPEQGLAMTGDGAGCFPLYHGASADHVVVSNRSTTVAHALGSTAWNLQSLAWLVSTSLIAGDEVGIEGARIMPPGRIARVGWGGTRMVVDAGPHPSLAAAGRGPGRTDLSSAEWDEVTDALIAEVRAIGRLEAPKTLPITGGKDSRLVLALAKAAGVTDLTTFTTGGPDHPEVRCAAKVASVAGYAHEHDVPDEVRRPPARSEVVGPGPKAPLDGRPWHRLARANGRYEGNVSAWAGYKTPLNPASLILKGWGGENYRFRSRAVPCADRFLDAQVPVTNGAQVLSTFFGRRVDPLRLLVPDERARQVAWFDQHVHAVAADLRLDLVLDDIWLSHKSNQYQGSVLQSTPLRLIANPLVCTGALRRYAELSLQVRRTDRLHYEVMRRAAPELVVLPFYEQTWSPEIRAGTDRSLGTRAAALLADAQGRLRSSPARWRAEAAARVAERRLRVDVFGGTRVSSALAAGNEPVWQIMADDPAPIVTMLREASDVGLGSICRIDRVCDLVERRPRLTRREELQVTDAIGIAMLLLGRIERVVDTP